MRSLMGFPVLSDQFFRDKRPSREFFALWRHQGPWGPALLPVYEWDGILYVAAAEPLEHSHKENWQYVKANAALIGELWAEWSASFAAPPEEIGADAPFEFPDPQPESPSEPGPEGDEAASEDRTTVLAPPDGLELPPIAAVEVPVGLVQEAQAAEAPVNLESLQVSVAAENEEDSEITQVTALEEMAALLASDAGAAGAFPPPPSPEFEASQPSIHTQQTGVRIESLDGLNQPPVQPIDLSSLAASPHPEPPPPPSPDAEFDEKTPPPDFAPAPKKPTAPPPGVAVPLSAAAVSTKDSTVIEVSAKPAVTRPAVGANPPAVGANPPPAENRPPEAPVAKTPVAVPPAPKPAPAVAVAAASAPKPSAAPPPAPSPKPAPAMTAPPAPKPAPAKPAPAPETDLPPKLLVENAPKRLGLDWSSMWKTLLGNTGYQHGMIMLFQGGYARPWEWDPQLEGSHQGRSFTIQQPSPLRIVARTQKPYHGYVVENEVSKQFFADWNGSSYPEHLTVVPILQEDLVVGFLLAWGSQIAATKESLQLAEKSAQHISRIFQTEPSLMSVA